MNYATELMVGSFEKVDRSTLDRSVAGDDHGQDSASQLLVAVRPLSTLGARAQKPMTLTAMDYIEIQQLVAKYAKFIDSCSNNGYDYADLYTADGIFMPSINGKPSPASRGARSWPRCRAAGQRLQERRLDPAGRAAPLSEPRHRGDARGAKGTVDMLMIGLGGDPNKIQYDGHYEDIYVKTPQGWRFKQRTHFALLSGGRPAAPAPAAK
jgi:hypothetical protein